MYADVILAVTDVSIVEYDIHAELIKYQGYYIEMYTHHNIDKELVTV